MTSERDRDPAGRALNSRPRDRLGRPLPRGAAGVERVTDTERSPAETLTEAQRLLDDGQPFAAHEVLETAWKTAPESERALWKGLAQLAVGLTHLLRGNTAGAISLLGRGQSAIRDYAPKPPHGIDVAGLLTWADAVSGVAEAGRDVATPRLRSGNDT